MRMGGAFLRTFGAHRKLVWISYGVQLILAIPLAFLTYRILGDVLGESLSSERLIGDFDYVLWRDLLNRNSEAMSRFIRGLTILLPIALVCTSFLTCGIYKCLQRKRVSIRLFAKGVQTLWWRYMFLSTIALMILMVWSLGVWRWYFSDLFRFLEYWEKDSHIVWLGLGLLGIWVLGLYLIFIVTNLAKVDQLDQKQGIVRSLIKAVRQSFGVARRLSLPLLFLALLGLATTVFYLVVSSALKPTSVVALFFLQQLTSWLKVGLRIASCDEVHSCSLGTVDTQST